MIHASFRVVGGLTLALAIAAPAHAQRDRFLDGVRALAAAAQQPDPARRARAIHDAATAMRSALAQWDGTIGTPASRSDAELRRALTLDAAGREGDAGTAFRAAWELDPQNAAIAYYVARHGAADDRPRAQAALIGAYERISGSSQRSRVQNDLPYAPFVTVDAIPDNLAATPVVADAATADAFALLRAGRYAEALDALQRLGTAPPAVSVDSPATHFPRGRAAELEGRIADARREYQAALAGTLVGRGVLYVGLARLAQVDGDPAAAIDAFTAAAQLDPNDANIHKELAMALAAQRQDDEALCEAVAALLIDPRDAQAHAIVGQVYLDSGRSADAVTPLSRALALQPDRYETHYALATAFTRLGRTSDASRELAAFERGRVDAVQRRRRQIANEVDRAEAARRGLDEPEGK